MLVQLLTARSNFLTNSSFLAFKELFKSVEFLTDLFTSLLVRAYLSMASFNVLMLSIDWRMFNLGLLLPMKALEGTSESSACGRPRNGGDIAVYYFGSRAFAACAARDYLSQGPAASAVGLTAIDRPGCSVFFRDTSPCGSMASYLEWASRSEKSPKFAAFIYDCKL